MKLAKPLSRLASHGSGRAVRRLDALLLYNCPQLAHRAARRVRGLEEDGTAILASTRIVNLTQLETERSFKLTATDASLADVVLVGLDLSHELPPRWNLWFWEWAQFRLKKSGILLVLGKGDREAEDLLREFFHQIAWMAGVACEVEWEEGTGTVTGLSQLASRGRPLGRPRSAYGIS